MPPVEQSPAIARHFGLDWLRIGAFALLILYHIALYFGPGPWIVKSPQEVAWAGWLATAITPWRLTLLFAVSGYATAAMIERHPNLGAFLIERSKRLLIPLLFGVIVVVPPQDWVRLEVGGIDHSYLSYLLADNFSFGTQDGVFHPNWEHLWFLPWLWAFTALLTATLALLPRWHGRLAWVVAWLVQGRRLLYVPAAAILGMTAVLWKLHMWTVTDSADFLPAFIFGFAYGHFPQMREATGRLAREALPLAGAMLVVWLWAWTKQPGGMTLPRALIGLAAYSQISWAMLVALFHLADRFLNIDHKLRRPLAAAVFPAYIVHQTIIVMLGWYLARWHVTGLPAFALLLVAVLAGCFLAWWLAKTSRIAGLMLGMPHKPGAKAALAQVNPPLPAESLP